MKYYIDAKITTWERHHYNSEAELREAINLINKGGYIEGFDSVEPLPDTTTEMEIEDNNGCHTIEAYIGDEIIWTNEEIEK